MRSLHPTARRIAAAALTTYAALTALAAPPEPEWTLYNTVGQPVSTLIDLDGNIVHTWPSAYPAAHTVYLMDDGAILRTANDGTVPGPSAPGGGGRIQKIAWDGTLEWDYAAGAANFRQHHDIEPLPNGNVLVVVWVAYTPAEAIAVGRDPARITGYEVWSDSIYEIQPTGPTTGQIVWQWNAWDNLVQNFDPLLPNYGEPSDHPERIDINYGPTADDWIHVNTVDYNEELDQVLISANFHDELWIVDHAPGASSELLYRWGNPAAYGLGTPDDQKIFRTHNMNWIPPGHPGAGNLIFFNNGVGRPELSSADELTPPVNPDGTYARTPGEAWGPTSLTWTCDTIGGATFSSNIFSNAQRLLNGNTLICVGTAGMFAEVDTACNLEWTHTPGGGQFRAERIYARDPRLEGLLWCHADLDDDADTDVFDFSLFADNFGAGPGATFEQGDLDGDGFVTVFDFGEFANDFGCGTGP